MTRKFHIILIIFVLGFFGTPTSSYACGTKSTKTEKSCCKKNKESNKAEKKSCCKKKSANNSDGCDGNCNDSDCSCPTTNSTVFALTFYTELYKQTTFPQNKISKSYYNETYLSSGFHSIWQPPKIG